MFIHKNITGLPGTDLMRNLTQWLAMLISVFFLSQSLGQAQTAYQATCGGYMFTDIEPTPTSYDAGYSFYATAWPLLGDYPKNNTVQTGLFGTWLYPSRSVDNGIYTTIEGGLGWWGDRYFQTATPKFIMGGVSWGFGAWWFANGPGSGTTGGGGKYGIAQLSPTLLFPPDGLNLAQGTTNKLLGYGYLALPLTEPKATTAGRPIPTGNHCWTLFMNSGNFKGPAAFFTPYFWSQISLTLPASTGESFDARWSVSDRYIQMESQETVHAAAVDTPDGTYLRSLPVYFPVDETGYSLFMHRPCAYNQGALWNETEQWLNAGGPAPSGIINTASTFPQVVTGYDPLWDVKAAAGKIGTLDWSKIAKASAPNTLEWGYQFDTTQVPVIASGDGSVVKMPEYYKTGVNANGSSKWSPIEQSSIPQPVAAALAAANLQRRTTRRNLTVVDSDPVWTSPGPQSGPYHALLGDGSVVTYYWYRFADQPAILKADMTLAERNRLQGVVEKMHREWKNDRDYIAPPSTGDLANLDLGQLVTPPLGLEYGYVPVAWSQDWGGSVASSGALKFTSIPTSSVADSPFNVTIQAQNASGVAQNVTEDTRVQLSAASGYGTLAGNITGTILKNSSSVTITGVTYSAADVMTLTASATCLSQITSPGITFTNLSGRLNLYNRPATSTTSNQVTLNATLGCSGTNAAVTVYWGPYNGGKTSSNWANSISVGNWTNTTSVNINQMLTGLLPETVYYFNFCATNAAGTTWGNKVLTFKTLPLAPTITTQPVNLASVVGSTASLFVTALRATNYQWYKNGAALINGGQVSGSTTATLRLSGVALSDAGSYYVIASNSGGQAASTTVSLSILAISTVTWDANGTSSGVTDGGGAWQSNRWWKGSTNINWADGNNAQIGSGGVGGVITLGEVMVNGLSMSNFRGDYTLNNGALTMRHRASFDSTSSVNFNSTLRGPGSVIKNGTGTLTLAGVPGNTYSGGTVINSGRLVWGTVINGVSPDCGLALGTGPVTLNAGAVIEFQHVTASNPMTLNGGTILSPNGWGVSLSGAIALNGIVTSDADYSQTISGNISGAGGFTKQGNGQLHLLGSNSFKGMTTVKKGTLKCAATGLGKGPLNIITGGQVDLAFAGTRIIESLSFDNGGGLPPGTYGSSASPATYKYDGYFTPSSTGTITILVGASELPISSGLVLRMDASQIAGTSDGAQLNTWSDSSGGSNNATRQTGPSTGYPQYVSNSINGLPVVRFNSANAVGDYFKFSRISTIRSVFWVMKEKASLSDGHFLLGDSSTYDFHRAATPNGPLWNSTYASPSITAGATALMGNTINGSTTSLPSGSFQLVSLVTTGNVSADQICQDRVYHGSWQGDIAEILIYDRALSDTEEKQVGYYLSKKYDLATSYNVLPVPKGLVLRVDASEISGTANGDQLNTWPDTSGAANSAIRQDGSSTGYPKYITDGINGRPVVRFNSGNSGMGDSFKFNEISTIRSVFWVLKENPSLNDNHFLLGNSSSYDFHRGNDPNGSLWDAYNGSINIKTGITRLMGTTIDGTTTALPSGNFQLVSLVTSGNVSANQLCQDRTFHGSWQGDIAEILIYNRTLTTREEALVGTYLATKYRLVTSYPLPLMPSVPLGVAAVADATGTVRVSWSAVPGATTYQVWIKNTQTGNEQPISSSNPYCLVTNLTTGTRYEFKVAAGYENGVFGDYSAAVTTSSSAALYASWSNDLAQGLTVGNDGPMDDPDHDGILNLMEFVLGGQPMAGSTSILPKLSKAGDEWSLEYSRSKLSQEMTQVVEYSSDLIQWTPITILAESSSGVVVTPGILSDRIKVAIPVVAGKPTFARLKINQ